MSTKKKSRKENKLTIAWRKFRKYLPKSDVLTKVLAGTLALLTFLSVFIYLLY